MGKLLIILAIGSDPHLHTPMYFFLAKLSYIDTYISCTIVPKVLVNIQTQHHTICYTGCFVQMYFFMALTLLDYFLLAVIAYGHYMSICLPFHYTMNMNPYCCSPHPGSMTTFWPNHSFFSCLSSLSVPPIPSHTSVIFYHSSD